MLKKDPRWVLYPKVKNFKSFCELMVPELYLKKEVPQDIQVNNDISKKLLCHGYFEYEFIDIAITHLVFTLEKALKIRYKEINNADWTGKFNGIINWFFNQGYFETENKFVIHQLRHLRNGKVHDSEKSLGGIVYLAKANVPVDLVNDIYENKALRKKRKTAASKVNFEIKKILHSGGILTIGDLRYIIVGGMDVFVNNKYENEIHHCLFLPIFDPEPYRNNNYIVPKVFKLKIKDFQIDRNKNILSGIECSTNKPVLVNSMDSKNKQKFESWHLEIENLKDSQVIKSLVDIPINDFFLASLREFHKIP